MFEQLGVYGQMARSTQALLLLPVGLSVGSFCSVLYHRLQVGRSIVHPRSHCPACEHPLGFSELIPVVSYACLGGKCRHCGTPVPLKYPLLELGCGASATVGALTGGWLRGWLLVLLWPVGAAALAVILKHRRRLQDNSGVTLIETLVATMLLLMLMAPVFNAVTVSRHADLASERGALAVGLARGQMNQMQAVAWESGVSALTGSDNTLSIDKNGITEQYRVRSVVSDYPPAPATPDSRLKLVTITVACEGCTGNFGMPVRPVEVTVVMRGAY